MCVCLQPGDVLPGFCSEVIRQTRGSVRQGHCRAQFMLHQWLERKQDDSQMSDRTPSADPVSHAWGVRICSRGATKFLLGNRKVWMSLGYVEGPTRLSGSLTV